MSGMQGRPGLRPGRANPHVQCVPASIPDRRRHSGDDRRGGRKVLIRLRSWFLLQMRRAWMLVLPAMVMASASHAVPAGVRLLPSGPSMVHFMMDVPEARMAPAPDAIDAYGPVSVAIDGFSSQGAAGGPPLPGRYVDVAVPPP